MRKAERGFGSGRVACIALLGSLGVALAGCGDDSGSGSAGEAAATQNTTGSQATSSASSSSNTGATVSPGVTSNAGRTNTTTTTSPTVSEKSSNVTLAWVPPTQNNNGTPLTNLVGYKIYYGKDSQNYSQTIQLANAGLTRYVVDNLPSGTYYFAITAYNSAGVESSLSGEVSAALN